MISQDTQWASKKDSQSHTFVCFVLVPVRLSECDSGGDCCCKGCYFIVVGVL